MRIRTIKPEFFTHEGIFDAERDTGLPIRIAFAGLWCVADREGKFKWEPRRIGVQILPYDDLDFNDVLHVLVSRGFVLRSACGHFGKIPSFLDHQCPNLRESASAIPDEAFTCEHVQAQEPTYEYRGVNIQPKLRAFVLLRDGNKCVRCNSTQDLTVDHIFPQSIGGTHALKNLRTLCRSCNSARPVQGQGLLDDLKKDGLSINDLQGICMHVHARVEGKGKEGNKERNGKEQGTRDELCSYAVEIGLTENDGNFLFEHFEETKWKRGKDPVKDWKATMRKWKAGGWLPSQKAPNGSSPKRQTFNGIQENLDIPV